MVMLFGCVFSAIGLVFIVLFLIDCVCYRKDLNTFASFGLFLGIVVLAFDLFVIALRPDVLEQRFILQLILVDIIVFVKITLGACMGIYCCTQMDLPSIPLLGKCSWRPELQRSGFNRGGILWALAVAAGAVAFSVALFKLTSPQMSEYVKQLTENRATTSDVGAHPSLAIAVSVPHRMFSLAPRRAGAI